MSGSPFEPYIYPKRPSREQLPRDNDVEFAVNDSWQESVQETPFMLNYGQHPLNAFSLDTHSNVPAAIAHTVKWQDTVERAKECLGRAQQRQKAYADQKRRDVTYKVRDELLLNTKNIRESSTLKGVTAKLRPRWAGPYTVTGCVGRVAYRLALPAQMAMQPAFHVSLLQPYTPGGRVQPPKPFFVRGELAYNIEKIVAHKQTRCGGRLMTSFLVRWEGYGAEQDSWEPEASMLDPVHLQEYWNDVAAKKATKLGSKRKH